MKKQKDSIDEEILQIPDSVDEVVEKASKKQKKHVIEESKRSKIFKWCKNHKKISIFLVCLSLLCLILTVPFTRYPLLGFVIKKPLEVTIVDEKTRRPVSEADVFVSGHTARTDGNGKVRFENVSVGKTKVLIKKSYYVETTAEQFVSIRGSTSTEIVVQATGRQVPVQVINIINATPISGAEISSGESRAKTDEKGQALIVLPPDQEKLKATIKKQDYNERQVEIAVTDVQVNANNFEITPVGKVHFLSKQSGKVDVVSTNLDGSEKKVVLAGTGSEDEYNTSLLASRDWKHLALKANRDGKTKLYLIRTSDDSLSIIEEGTADIVSIGWYDQFFVYQIARSGPAWQSSRFAIKSFNADSKGLITLDETKAEGTSDIDYAVEGFGQVYILENELVYAKTWQSDYYSGGRIYGKKNSINSIRPNGHDKRLIKEFEAKPNLSTYIDAKLYEPQELYFQVTDYTQHTYYEYEDGKLGEDPKVTLDEYTRFYPTFLVSPSGNKTFWSETRDGKNVLFVGNRNADDEREVGAPSDFQTYGWYSDEYLLKSKNNSELYITSLTNPEKSIKISDYHKPSGVFSGYGYGYGGL